MDVSAISGLMGENKMIKTIEIDDWFNIWEGSHNIKLANDKLNILVGANGTGKTTTLRHLSAVMQKLTED